MFFNFFSVSASSREFFAACIRADRSASVEVRIERQIIETNVLTKVISSNRFIFPLPVLALIVVVVSLLRCIFIELFFFYHFEKWTRNTPDKKISTKKREKQPCMTLLSEKQFFFFLFTYFVFLLFLTRPFVQLIRLWCYHCRFCFSLPFVYKCLSTL